MTPKAVLRTLSATWNALGPLKLPMALMGGLALSAWKHVRATQDVDLLVGIGDTTPDVPLQNLTQAGFRPKRDPPIVSLGPVRLLQLEFKPEGALVDLQVDIILADSDYHSEALNRRVALRLPEIEQDVFVLSCEDLILHKLLAGRIIDRADGAALLRANRDSLDLDYVSRWIELLGVQAEFAEIWEEALPGQPFEHS